MEYRIKITKDKNGDELFEPQFRIIFWWFGINFDGYVKPFITQSVCKSRESALKIIDKHFEKNDNETDYEYFEK